MASLSPPPHILIIGGGAIGGLLAVRLARASARVALAARPRTVQAARAQHGIHLVEPNRQAHHQDLPVYPSIAEAMEQEGSFDLLILAVKAYHTQAAAQEIQAAGGAGTPVLTVQNGVGNEETLMRLLPHSPILSGALTTPVEVIGPARFKIARPSYHFGLAPTRAHDTIQALGTLFQAAGFRVRMVDDYRRLKWSKLLMNILANAQAAIYNLTPAQIFARPDLAQQELNAWREALDVMRRAKVAPIAFGGYPLPLAAWLVEHGPPGLVRPLFARFIAAGRGDKMPSLYYDLHPQPRPHSEIHWLNGAVVQKGQKQGVPTPVNRELVQAFEKRQHDALRGKRDQD